MVISRKSVLTLASAAVLGTAATVAPAISNAAPGTSHAGTSTAASAQSAAGTYTVSAWHELYGASEQSVTIGPKESKAVTITFKASAAGD